MPENSGVFVVAASERTMVFEITFPVYIANIFVGRCRRPGCVNIHNLAVNLNSSPSFFKPVADPNFLCCFGGTNPLVSQYGLANPVATASATYPPPSV